MLLLWVAHDLAGMSCCHDIEQFVLAADFSGIRMVLVNEIFKDLVFSVFAFLFNAKIFDILVTSISCSIIFSRLLLILFKQILRHFVRDSSIFLVASKTESNESLLKLFNLL